MNNDSIFLIVGGIVLSILIIATALHNRLEVEMTAQGIAAGGDPIAVNCAYDPVSYCDIVASQTINQSK